MDFMTAGYGWVMASDGPGESWMLHHAIHHFIGNLKNHGKKFKVCHKLYWAGCCRYLFDVYSIIYVQWLIDFVLASDLHSVSMFLEKEVWSPLKELK